MLRRRPIRRDLKTPHVDGNDAFRRLARQENKRQSIDTGSSMSPHALALILEDLLPEEQKGRTRLVQWSNPEAQIIKRGTGSKRIEVQEYIRATMLPKKLGGLTVLETMTAGRRDSESVRYTFPTVDRDTEFPRVEVTSSVVDCYEGCMRSTVRRSGDYIRMAPGIGIIMEGLIAQADETVVTQLNSR